MAPRTPIDRLLLIFDAQSGAAAAFVDSAKKVLRVQGCALCEVTHGIARERSEWRSCKEELGVPVDYLHRDEIPEHLAPIVGELPCIVAETAKGPVPLVPASAIKRCR